MKLTFLFMATWGLLALCGGSLCAQQLIPLPSEQSVVKCATDDSHLPAAQLALMKKLPELVKLRKGPNDQYVCRLGIEIDYYTYNTEYKRDTLLLKADLADMIQQVSRVYEQETNLKIQLANVNIITEPSKDPYAATDDVIKMLNLLQSNYRSTMALGKLPLDIVMYLPSRSFTGAGGVANGIGSKFNVSPWGNISTIIHELGHNLGSPHTQSCSWPGGPLDFCYAAEGSCYSEALERFNGTVMSYCGRRYNTFHPLSRELIFAWSNTKMSKLFPPTEIAKTPEVNFIGSQVYVNWPYLLYASRYVVEYAADKEFKGIVSRDTVGQAYAVPRNLEAQKNYFVRVKSVNRLGESPWSEVGTFTTPANYLAVPRHIAPLHKATMVDGVGFQVSYEAVPGATGYELQLLPFHTGSNGNVHRATASSTKTTNTFAKYTFTGEAISWRVRATNGTLIGNWSEPTVFWMKPNPNTLDITTPPVADNYPLQLAIQTTGHAGDILSGKLTVSENPSYQNPVFNKQWEPNQYSGGSYAAFLDKLKPATTYYVKYEESNNSPITNLLGLPAGVVRSIERQFKTGTAELPTNMSYTTDVLNTAKTPAIRQMVFGNDVQFVLTADGLTRTNLADGKSQLYNQRNTRGVITNTIYDMAVDNQGFLWILNAVSKRVRFSGLFPLTTFRLSKLNPATLQTLESAEYTSTFTNTLTTFDPQTKIMTAGSSVFKPSADTLFRFSPVPAAYTPVLSPLFTKDGYYQMARQNSGTLVAILKRTALNGELAEYKSNLTYTSATTGAVLDSEKESVWFWADEAGKTALYRWTEADGYQKILDKETTWTNPVLIGVRGTQAFFMATTAGRTDVLRWDGEKVATIATLPFNNPVGSRLDKQGTIWVWQSAALLRIKPCGTIAAPRVISAKTVIRKGETLELRAEGCQNVEWLLTDANGITSKQRTLNGATLNVQPQGVMTYKASCITGECTGDLSQPLAVSVVDLAINNLAKNNYCQTERVGFSPRTEGTFGSQNIFTAVLQNTLNRYEFPLSAALDFTLPASVQSGTYWVKLRASAPAIESADSASLTILGLPTATLAADTKAYVLDSALVTARFTGVPPFTFRFNDKGYISDQPTWSAYFAPAEPKTYTLTFSDLTDANCPALPQPWQQQLVATLNPAYENLWVQSFPNPVDTDLNLHVYNKPGNFIELALYDSRGRLLERTKTPIKTYLDKLRFSMLPYQAGVYYLIIKTGYRTETRRLLRL